MRLHVADGPRVHLRGAQHLGDDFRLPLRARCIEADFLGAIVVDGDAADHCVDVITVGNSIRCALEQHHRDAFAADHAVGRDIEYLHMAVTRKVQSALVYIPHAVGSKHRGRADQCLPDLACQQTPAGRLQPDERRRTIRVHGKARTFEAQAMRDHRRNRAALAEKPGDVLFAAAEHAGPGALRARSPRCVVTVAARHENCGISDLASDIAGVFHSLPRMLQQQP